MELRADRRTGGGWGGNKRNRALCKTIVYVLTSDLTDVRGLCTSDDMHSFIACGGDKVGGVTRSSRSCNLQYTDDC